MPPCAPTVAAAPLPFDWVALTVSPTLAEAVWTVPFKLPVAKFDWVLTPAPETLLAPERALALPAPLLTVAMAPVLVPLETLVPTDVLVFCAWATPALSPAIAAIAKMEMRGIR